MIRELNQDLKFKNDKDQSYQDALADGYTSKYMLPKNKSVLNENLRFELIDLDENQIDYMEDFIDLIDQYRDDVETFSENNSVKPPAYMALAAKVGLEIRNKEPKSNKCCMPTGLARANQLVKRQNLSLKTLKRIKSFAARHGANIKSDTEKTSKLWQSLMLWGIPYSSNFIKAKKNVERVINWTDSKIKKLEES